MAEHKRFSLATDVKVYFCDPQQPWQRGSNENTNGLLRQYFPKGMDLSGVNQNRLNALARRLNERPRETLNFETPAERFTQCVASTGWIRNPKRTSFPSSGMLRQGSKMLRSKIAALGVFACIAACGRQADSNATVDGEVRRDFAPLSGNVISPYSGGLAQPEYRIVQSRDEWQDLWRELEPRTSREQGQTSPNPVPDIDFQQRVLIVAAMGARPTGGYSVEITSLVESSQRIVVTVAEQLPGPKCTTTQAVTHPIAIVTTARSQKPFEFEFVRTTQPCT
jgi:PrcB C-terminal